MARQYKFGLKFLTTTKKGKGFRFVEITPKVFDMLYESEKQNIIKMAKYTTEDIRKIDKQAWQEMSANSLDKGAKIIERYLDIAKGVVTAEVEDIIIGNYVMGLKARGRDDLAERFEKLAKLLKKEMPDQFDTFMKYDFPELNLYYEDKDRTHTKRQATFSMVTAINQLDKAESMLHSYEVDPVIAPLLANENSREE